MNGTGKGMRQQNAITMTFSQLPASCRRTYLKPSLAYLQDLESPADPHSTGTACNYNLRHAIYAKMAILHNEYEIIPRDFKNLSVYHLSDTRSSTSQKGGGTFPCWISSVDRQSLLKPVRKILIARHS